MFWRTAEQGTLAPAPTLKTDVSIVVTGIVARAQRASGVHEPRRRVGGRSLRLPAARGRGGRSPPHEGRRPVDRRRHPGAIRGEGTVRAGEARRPAREPRRAGATERLHHVGRQHRSRRRDRHRDRVPADRPVRRWPVPPTVPDGGRPSLHPRDPGRGSAGRQGLVSRYRRGAGRVAHHSARRASLPRTAESGQPCGRAGSGRPPWRGSRPRTTRFTRRRWPTGATGSSSLRARCQRIGISSWSGNPTPSRRPSPRSTPNRRARRRSPSSW